MFVWVGLVAACFSLRAFFRSTGAGVMAVGLAVFTYLALRRALARASPAEPTGLEAGRRWASWPWRVAVVLAALAGFWVLGVHVSAAVGFYDILWDRLGPILSPGSWLLWWTGIAAVGATAAALVRLWMGGSLGRWYGGVFGLGLGWLIGFGVTISGTSHGFPDRAGLRLAALHEGLVVGIVAMFLLPRYSARAARGAALAASPVLGIILLGALAYLGKTLILDGYVHLRHLILALAGACLVGLGAGILGAVAGAVGDRREIVLRQPPLPAAPDRARRSWLAAKVRPILRMSILGFLLVVGCLAIVDLWSREPTVLALLKGLGPASEGFDKVVQKAYSDYEEGLRADAKRRQTEELPPIDRVEVFALGEGLSFDEPAFPKHLFPMAEQGDRGGYVPILRQVGLTGADAEALAQLWRTAKVGQTWLPATLPPRYGLRFYAGRRLVLEVGPDYLTDGGLAHPWVWILAADEPLAVRLQQLVPLPDKYLVDSPIARGFEHLRGKRYDDAEAAFRRAIELDAGNATAYVGLGRAFQARGDLDKALAAYNEAIRLARRMDNADNVAARYHRAQIYHAMRDYPLALADLNVVIGGAPPFDVRSPYCLRAAVYLELGMPSVALVDLEMAVPHVPNDPEVPRLRAKAYQALGNSQAAEQELQKARDLERGKLEEK
jgi:tetratricopeptide (TPR) repeat protein